MLWSHNENRHYSAIFLHMTVILVYKKIGVYTGKSGTTLPVCLGLTHNTKQALILSKVSLSTARFRAGAFCSLCSTCAHVYLFSHDRGIARKRSIVTGKATTHFSVYRSTWLGSSKMMKSSSNCGQVVKARLWSSQRTCWRIASQWAEKITV